MEKIYRLPAVEQIIGLHRATIYRMIGRNEFPSSITIVGRNVGWLESEIEAWQQKRIAARDSGSEAA